MNETLKDINLALKHNLKHEFKQKVTLKTALFLNHCFEKKVLFFF